MSKRIHIVSFDVPSPADYGGVIDVFSRVKWFSENGWDIILHCFEYKRPRAKELEKYTEVHYYKRPGGVKYWFSKTPFIVNTRINKELEKILKNTKDEVLLEGLHCSHYLHLQPGKFYLRTHNIEHEYYARLAQNASTFKKMFFMSEAKKLRSYESILAKAKGLLVISKAELAHFTQINANSFFVPPYFKTEEMYQLTEPVVLFQGNLSVEENDEAAHWILDNVQPNSEASFIIAGKNPSELLRDKCRTQNVELIQNPSTDEMQLLIDSARIHLLWTNNSSGLKLKFLNAMASSGHVICNSAIVSGSGLSNGFHITDDSKEVLRLLDQLMILELEPETWELRQEDIRNEFGGLSLAKVFP